MAQDVQRQVMANFVTEGSAHRRRMMRGVQIDKAAFLRRLGDFLEGTDIKSAQRHTIAFAAFADRQIYRKLAGDGGEISLGRHRKLLAVEFRP